MSPWTEAMEALADVVRNGRQVSLNFSEWTQETLSVEIGYAEIGGTGLALALTMDGLGASLWCEEQAWCDWIAPMLVTADFSSTPPELRVPLASWGLMPLSASAEQAGLPPPLLLSVQSAEISTATACILTLRRGASVLRLRVLQGPHAWLHQLVLSFDAPMPAPALGPRLPVTLAAGYVRLSASQMSKLAPGNAVMLGMSAEVEHGQALIRLEHAVVRMDYLNEEQWKVNELIMQEQDENPIDSVDESHATALLNGLTFSVAAEIGRIELTVEEMRTLERGMIIGAPASFDGTVLLRVGGRTIGKGQLLRIGERLAVRIQ